MVFGNTVPGCVEPHQLWHLDLPDWPDSAQREHLALKVGDLIEDAWGVRQRRYLARSGALAGNLDVRRLQG